LPKTTLNTAKVKTGSIISLANVYVKQFTSQWTVMETFSIIQRVKKSV